MRLAKFCLQCTMPLIINLILVVQRMFKLKYSANTSSSHVRSCQIFLKLMQLLSFSCIIIVSVCIEGVLDQGATLKRWQTVWQN
jgi:hypothetical protein